MSATEGSVSKATSTPAQRPLFVDPPDKFPSFLCCPICHFPCIDARINVTCGHSFCEACLAGLAVCPLDRAIVPQKPKPVVNHAINAQVGELLVHCPNCAQAPAHSLSSTSTSTGAGNAASAFDSSTLAHRSSWGTSSSGEKTVTVRPEFGPPLKSSSGSSSISSNGEIDASAWAKLSTSVASQDNGRAVMPLMHDNNGSGLAKAGDDEPGCPAILPLKDLAAHLDVCPFEYLQCPNSELCGVYRRSDLAHHVQRCRRSVCVFRCRGCAVTGTRSEMHEHQTICPFKEAPGEAFSSEVSALREACISLRQLRSEINSRVGVLAQRLHRNLGQATQLLKGTETLARSRRSQLLVADFVMPFHFQCIGTFRGHRGAVWAAASFSNFMFTSASDEVIKVWDMTRMDCIRTLQPKHHGVVYALCVQGGTLIAGDSTGTIETWNASSFERIGMGQLCPDIIADMVAADGHVFAASLGTVSKIAIDQLEVRAQTSDLGHWVRCLAMPKDSHDIVFAACQHFVRAYATTDLNQLFVIQTNFGSIRSITVTANHIITGTHNQNTHVYDKRTKQHAFQLVGHVGSIQTLLMAPGDHFVLTGSLDTSIRVWDLNKNLVVQVLTRHDEGVNVLHWHRDLLVSGSADGEVKLYKFVKGEAAE